MPTQHRHSVTADQLDAWLPQTQCTQCGYPRCRAYAEAMADGEAGINQCPPGGEVTIAALAGLLHVPPQPLNPRFGIHKPRMRAVIDESICIGCRKCIDVCPVDAILGSRKLMHTVLARECNGCALCLPPCPVDCIALQAVDEQPGSGPWPEYARAESDHWRARTEKRLDRLARRKSLRPEKSSGAPHSPAEVTAPRSTHEMMREEIRAAVARAKEKKARQSGSSS